MKHARWLDQWDRERAQASEEHAAAERELAAQRDAVLEEQVRVPTTLHLRDSMLSPFAAGPAVCFLLPAYPPVAAHPCHSLLAPYSCRPIALSRLLPPRTHATPQAQLRAEFDALVGRQQARVKEWQRQADEGEASQHAHEAELQARGAELRLRAEELGGVERELGVLRGDVERDAASAQRALAEVEQERAKMKVRAGRLRARGGTLAGW